MSPIASLPSSTRRTPASSPRARVRLSPGSTSPVRRERPLGIGRALAGYVDLGGRPRELLALPGHGGSVLVLDRDAATLCDRRLVAHLAADEPAENAALVCKHYLEDPGGRWCRRVQREDLLVDPVVESRLSTATLDRCDPSQELTDHHGRVYSIGLFPAEGSTPQLRWCRRQAGRADSPIERVALRDTIGALERYEPIRALTEQALAAHRVDPGLLVTRLRNEFERLCASPVVLNRGLREAVVRAIDSRGLSMSEIALRCGVVKRDRRGKASGETSWVARRVGLMPEGGEKEITPWVHIDVLATIARKGLGVSPREVELQ